MRINNNTSSVSSNSSIFGSRVRKSESVNRSSTYTNAYKLEISNRAIDMLRQYEDDELATFNLDVLNYTKDLKLKFKY